jgi:hypothetical protein
MTLTMSYSRCTVRTVVAVAALGLALPCIAVHAATPHWLAVNAKKHAVTLTIIAAYTNALGGFNFNGYGDGKSVQERQ